MSSTPSRSQSKPLGRGFWALFATQFLGAFNDNLFKTSLAVAITFEAASLGSLGPTWLVALSGGLLILPFALFSALAGQLADRYPKQRSMRATKLAECVV